MGESGWYPPGAENDPSAPYNQSDLPDPECRVEVVCKAKHHSMSFTVTDDERTANVLAWAGFKVEPPEDGDEPALIRASFEVDSCLECQQEAEGPDPDAERDAENDARAIRAEEVISDHLAKQRIEAADREAFHKAAIQQAGEFARRNPHLVDDYSDADPGL